MVIHNHNTRSKYDLHTHFCKTTLLQKSVLNTGIKLFKHLPVRIKKADSFNCFKKEVTAVLLNNSCYSIEEFLHSKIV